MPKQLFRFFSGAVRDFSKRTPHYKPLFQCASMTYPLSTLATLVSQQDHCQKMDTRIRHVTPGYMWLWPTHHQMFHNAKTIVTFSVLLLWTWLFIIISLAWPAISKMVKHSRIRPVVPEKIAKKRPTLRGGILQNENTILFIVPYQSRKI